MALAEIQAKPVLSRPGNRRIPDGPGSIGMHRRVAFEHDGVWFGTVRTEPGVTSDWHHHGDYDTYIYGLAGELHLQCVDGDRAAEYAILPGDVLFLPKGVVHREDGGSGDGGEAVIVRFGHGQVVFPVDNSDLPAALRGA